MFDLNLPKYFDGKITLFSKPKDVRIKERKEYMDCDNLVDNLIALR